MHKFERVLDPKTDELEIKETQSASCNIRDTHLKMKRKRDYIDLNRLYCNANRLRTVNGKTFDTMVDNQKKIYEELKKESANKEAYTLILGKNFDGVKLTVEEIREMKLAAKDLTGQTISWFEGKDYEYTGHRKEQYKGKSLTKKGIRRNFHWK